VGSSWDNVVSVPVLLSLHLLEPGHCSLECKHLLLSGEYAGVGFQTALDT